MMGVLYLHRPVTNAPRKFLVAEAQHITSGSLQCHDMVGLIPDTKCVHLRLLLINHWTAG
jgi:hypothetical protein